MRKYKQKCTERGFLKKLLNYFITKILIKSWKPMTLKNISKVDQKQ